MTSWARVPDVTIGTVAIHAADPATDSRKGQIGSVLRKIGPGQTDLCNGCSMVSTESKEAWVVPRGVVWRSRYNSYEHKFDIVVAMDGTSHSPRGRSRVKDLWRGSG